jgi:ribosomal-protein-alanine N-acetyltransferase
MDTIGITLRSYRPEDLEALYALDVVCFQPPFRFSRTSMRRFAEARNALVVIAEQSALVAGFCIVHVERVRSQRIGYIVTLDVAPEQRRQGLAQTLMAEAEQQALAAGCGQLALHVHTGNEAALSFYTRIGFSLIGLELGFYGNGLDAQLWRKPLTLNRAE